MLDSASRTLRSKADDFFPKPVRIQALKKSVPRMLGKQAPLRPANDKRWSFHGELLALRGYDLTAERRRYILSAEGIVFL